jgi:hypothetical protein
LVLYDLVDAQFKPHATIGGYVAKGLTISPQTSGSTVNIYVDDAGTQGAEAASIGSSWDTPIRYLGNALQYVKDNAATLSGKTVNIYVKEGTYNNTNSYVDGRLRMVPIDVPSNVNLYGGYPDELTGTDLSATINGTLYQRNPLRYPSIITGKVTNDYQVNVAHLVTFNGSTDVVFDGFQVRYANASSTLLTNTDKNGGGMIFSNGARVSVRNTLIAGCTAEKGAAIFATGASQVTFVNCIIHNNTSSNLNGIIYSEGTANLTFNQCNFLRNVAMWGISKAQTPSRPTPTPSSSPTWTAPSTIPMPRRVVAYSIVFPRSRAIRRACRAATACSTAGRRSSARSLVAIRWASGSTTCNTPLPAVPTTVIRAL